MQYKPWRTSRAGYMAAVDHVAMRIRAVTDSDVHPEVMLAALVHVLDGLHKDSSSREIKLFLDPRGGGNPILVSLQDVVTELLLTE
jgi:hypothetical protein